MDELEQNGTSTRRIYELEARRMEMAVSFEIEREENI